MSCTQDWGDAVSEVYVHCLMGVQREGQSIFVIEGVEGTVGKVSKRR